jgi:outer membrane lipoprotein carrier protein
MKTLFLLLIISIISFANIFDIQNFKADFTQTIKNNSSNTISYKGNIVFDTNNILWHYNEPVKNVYISNSKVIIDEPELEQAIISNINEELNLISMLKESKKIDKNTYKNTLNNIIYTIKIYNNTLQAIFYTDELDNKVSIIFSNVKINTKVDKSIFIFNPPSYYDIIRK